MKIKDMVFLLFLLGGLLLAGCGNSGDAQQQMTFSTVQKGQVPPRDNNTAIPAQVIVIRDNTEWANFWNALYTNISVKPDLPSVNFNENAVVAVVDAPHSSGGYSVAITSITPTTDGVTVNCSRVSPGQGCVVTAAFTQPFHIVTVPNFSGTASLALSQATLNCGQ